MTHISPAFLKQLWLTFGASLSFLIIGLVRGYSASAIPSIEDIDPEIIQNSEQKSWIGAIPPLGAFIGSMLSGSLMQRAGRRRTLQLTAPIWFTGWLILGFANHFPLVLLGRIMTGCCVGFVLATAQVYMEDDDLLIAASPSPSAGHREDVSVATSISTSSSVEEHAVVASSATDSNQNIQATTGCRRIIPTAIRNRAVPFSTLKMVSECCDPEIRGRLGSLPTLSMSLGIVISYVAGNWLSWRYLAFFSSLFCVALFLVLFPLPESPVWLEGRGAGADTSQAIKWLHLSPRATATIKDDDVNEKTPDSENLPSLFSRKVFFSSVVIKPLIIGFALLFFQQFSGIDAVIFFTVEIFKSAGSTLDAMTATIVIGVVQLLSNGVSTMLVDRAGRRPLLLISAAVMCLSMAAMGTAFYLEFEPNSLMGYLPIVSLVVFMLGFSLGFGGLPFLLLGELFPAQYRSQLSAMASAVNLLSMFSVIKSYHALERVLTSAGTFWMYACFCAASFFFVLFMVPETKGKSLAEIEQHFRGKKDKLNNEEMSCHM